jgi:hypothetical protein
VAEPPSLIGVLRARAKPACRLADGPRGRCSTAVAAARLLTAARPPGSGAATAGAGAARARRRARATRARPRGAKRRAPGRWRDERRCGVRLGCWERARTCVRKVRRPSDGSLLRRAFPLYRAKFAATELAAEAGLKRSVQAAMSVLRAWPPRARGPRR